MRILRRNIVCSITLIFLFIPILVSQGHTNEMISIGVTHVMEAPLAAICQKFSQKEKFGCKITAMTNGHLYSHVMDGIGYDLIISSDDTYTEGLISADKAYPEHRLVFAKGRIVLWANDPKLTQTDLQKSITESHVLIGIANPSISPYGDAAKEALQNYHVWDQIQKRIVYSKSSLQTYEMVLKKEIPVGFVPLSAISLAERLKHHYWEPRANSYTPVLHEAIMIKNQRHPEATLALLAFLKSNESCEILKDAGFHCATKG